jgi:hypothetical protein
MRDPQDEIFAPKKNYQVIQLERLGNKFIFRAAQFGEPLQAIGAQDMPDMPDEILAGLFICSHDPDVVEEARVWNVRIDKPVEADYDPEKQGWIGCRLETMNVFDGTRMVIHELKGRFEAPNWMPDSKHIAFVSNSESNE